MKTREVSLTERLSTAAKATEARLARARAGDPSNKPGFADQQEARRIAAVARNTRFAQLSAARREAEELQAAERAAQKAARLAAATARATALEAERKAARDARYAARKARAK